MSINLSLFLIKYELDQMSSYLGLVSQAIDQKLESIEEEYHQLAVDESFMLHDQYLDELLETGRDFPHLLFTSFIIAWYSFVEQHLINLCDNLKLTITLGPRDQINIGTGIRRAKKFLADSRKYSIDNTHWQELVRIGKLRNALVHNGTRVSISFVEPDTPYTPHKFDAEGEAVIYIHMKKDLFQYLDKQHLIEQTGSLSFEIRPSFDYCEHLVEFGKILFTKLYADLYAKN